jgi:uncharacterized protein with NRDE domain
MCLVALALGVSERFPLVLASNRDEFFDRPSQALHWWDEPPMLGGRDLQGGGTWLGLSAGGRLALVTNIRRPDAQRADAASRGHIVPRWLARQTDTAAFWTDLQVQRFNGFNLIAGDLGRGEFAWASSELAQPQALAAGIHGLSNAELDAPWPKVETLKARLGDGLQRAAGRAELEAALFAALADDRRAADATLPSTGVPLEVERWLSAAFIHSPDGRYGTRCSTLLIAERTNEGLQIDVVERSHAHPGQRAGERRERLVLQAGEDRRP